MREYLIVDNPIWGKEGRKLWWRRDGVCHARILHPIFFFACEDGIAACKSNPNPWPTNLLPY